MSAVSSFSFRVICISIVASSSLPIPALADFVGASRCSLPGAPSQPALHIISGADRYLIPIGENGLTATILSDDRETFSWLAASGLFPDDTVFGNYNDFICGNPVEDVETEQVADLTPSPEPEEREEIIEVIEIPAE